MCRELAQPETKAADLTSCRGTAFLWKEAGCGRRTQRKAIMFILNTRMIRITRIGQAIRRAGGACMLGFLKLFCFLPVKDRRVLLSAYAGEQYSGNVKCVSEYLLEHWGTELELVWGFEHPERFRDIPGIKTVRYYSAAWFYYAMTANVIVTNVANARGFPKRSGQLFLDTWHGGGAYKRAGSGRNGMGEAERRSKYEAMEKIDLRLSSSEYFTRFLLWEDSGYRGEVLNSGMPRNDIFFSDERRTRASEKVRQALDLKGYVVLYAPTFRGRDWMGDRIDQHFPYELVLSGLRERTGGPVTVLKRAHHGCVMADSSPEEVIDVSDWPDMQELLCAADMLITDYSSCMWDFALLGRPCLLYQNDLETYERAQGICVPVEQWPGISCRNDRELLDAIRDLDEGACAEKAREHLRTYGSYETGTATEQTCRRIMEHIEGRQTGT